MMENNEQDLICSGCKNMFDENAHLPRMLPECGHTFCNSCLLDFLDKSDFIECPEDNRKEVVSFPKNYSLLNIMRKQKKQSEYQSPLHSFEQSTPLSDKGSSSRKGSLLHIRSLNGSIKSSHGEEEFQQIQQQKKKCKDHKKERDIVCLDCREAICSSCALFGIHKKHEVSSEEDVMKTISERAETLLQVYEELEEKSALINTNHYKDVIHTHMSSMHQSLQNEINQIFSNIIKQVEEKKSRLLDELNNTIQNQEQVFNKSLDLSKQNVLNEIEEWKKKAQEKLQNLCDQSSNRELSFDLLEEQNKSKADIIDVGERMLRQIMENNSNIQEKVKMISLQEIKLEQGQGIAALVDNLVKIKQTKDDKNAQNVKLQESLKQSEISYKQSIRSDFRKKTQYKKTKKYLDDFYNQNKKEKSHYPLNNAEKIFEAIEISEVVQDKQEDELIRRAEINNNNNNNNLIFQENDDLNEDQLKESLLYRQVSDVNNILNLEGLQQSQVISNDFTYKGPVITKEQLEQQEPFKNMNYQHQENVKLCNDDDDENLISQIHNKDFLLSSMLSYHNLSLNDINLLEEQVHTHEITGNADVKKSILMSLARDSNLLLEDQDEYKFLEESTKMNNDPNHGKSFISIKEQAKFLNQIQDIFSNTIDTVDFSNMDIGDKGLEILSIAIKENSSLNTIKLNKNKITDDGFIKLLDLIEHNCKNIENIYFQNNLVSEKSLNKLNELKKNPNCKIKNIYLLNNNLHDQKAIFSTLNQDNKQNNIIIHI